MEKKWHPWDRWECFKAGFYETSPPPPMSPEDARREYSVFLRDTNRFESALGRVISEWVISCEHFLSNQNINRIAWLGQASMCIDSGVPACFRSGFYLLSEEEQHAANATAERCLNRWIASHNGKENN